MCFNDMYTVMLSWLAAAAMQDDSDCQIIAEDLDISEQFLAAKAEIALDQQWAFAGAVWEEREKCSKRQLRRQGGQPPMMQRGPPLLCRRS